MKKTKSFRSYFIILFGLCTLIFQTQCPALADPDVYRAGIEAYKTGQYENAVQELTKVIDKEPENLDAFRIRGSSFMKLNRYDDAVRDFEKAVVLAPDRDGVYSDLGTAWYYSKNYEKALENYNIEIRKGHRNHLVFFNRALCLEQLGQFNKALADIETALQIKPDFYWGQCYKGNLLALKKEYAKAAQAYRTAIRLDEKDTYARERLALVENKVPAPQTPPPAPAGKSEPKGWEIQTGAFKNRDNAHKMKAQMIKKGFDARVIPIEDKNGTDWYLVRSGNYDTRESAVKEIGSYREKGFDCMVRPAGTW